MREVFPDCGNLLPWDLGRPPNRSSVVQDSMENVRHLQDPTNAAEQHHL